MDQKLAKQAFQPNQRGVGQVQSKNGLHPRVVDEHGQQIEDHEPNDPHNLKLIKQVEAEIEVAEDHYKNKHQRHLDNLKLYNNQRRDPETVGDTLLFTVFNTVLASFYQDRLSVDFLPNDFGDIETSQTLNATAKHDYDAMEKEKLDYFWLWDTLFYGRGYVSNEEFSRELKRPVPKNLDPLTFRRDPHCTSINGIGGINPARFFGYFTYMTEDELLRNNSITETDFRGLSGDEEEESIYTQSKRARDEAQGRDSTTQDYSDDLGENKRYFVTIWFTHWQGKKVKIYRALRKGKPVILGIHELGKADKVKWPIQDKSFSPMSGDADGVSVPDLVEDKQRANAILSNLVLKNAKDSAISMYLFDNNVIEDENAFNPEHNKHIPVDGNPNAVVTPLQRDRLQVDTVNYVMERLNTSAERAMATPEMQQGMTASQSRTLGELNLVASNVDTRYGLAVAILGWGEKDFWEYWYYLYKKHFKKDIDEKVIRIRGGGNIKFRTLTKENIEFEVDPDVSIVSKTVSMMEQRSKMQGFMSWTEAILQDPNLDEGRRNVIYREMGRQMEVDPDLVDMIVPKSIDEMKAEEENDALSENQPADIQADDDHYLHLRIHAAAADTPQKFGHIVAHQQALLALRRAPNATEQMLQQQAQQGQMLPGTPGGQPGAQMDRMAAQQGLPESGQPLTEGLGSGMPTGSQMAGLEQGTQQTTTQG